MTIPNRIERNYAITGLDAVVLLIHVLQGAKHPAVGFEDIDRTIMQLREQLDCVINVPESVLESALWSANLMDEAEAFWHPDGIKFEEFISYLTRDKAEFDRFYNMLKPKQEN